MKPGIPEGYVYYRPVPLKSSGAQPAGWRMPGLTKAIARFQFLSSTIAQYDGFSFSLKTIAANRSGGFATVFTYYIAPAPPPSPPEIGINIAGLVTNAQIGAATRAAILANGFALASDPTVLHQYTIQQLEAGSLGNTPISADVGLAGRISINGFNVGSIGAFFYNGQDAGIAAIFGRNRAMLPTASETTQGEAIG